MVNFGSINWYAIIVCVVLFMVNGALWYNPKTFFMVWWKGLGKADDAVPGMSNMALTWTLTVLSGFLQAVVMAVAVNAFGILMANGITAASGVVTGVILWLGFIAPTFMVNKMFAGQSATVWAIETGNHLLDFIIFGAILGAWR